jgi:hypothetical protein
MFSNVGTERGYGESPGESPPGLIPTVGSFPTILLPNMGASKVSTHTQIREFLIKRFYPIRELLITARLLIG